MPNKVFVDGREVFNARVSIATDANNAPVITPPVDTKPPARPVKPPSGVSVKDMGVLTSPSVGRKATLTQGTINAYAFKVADRNAPPGLYVEMVPTNSTQQYFEVWVSASPGGPPTGKYAKRTQKARSGDQIQLLLRRNDIARRNASPYTPDTQLYINMRATGKRTTTGWRVTGAFKK
jgi:hypothetical protein